MLVLTIILNTLTTASGLLISKSQCLYLADLGPLKDQVISSLNFVRSAYVPSDINTAIAVGMSEAVAGAISGLISRATARVIEDEKKDSLRTKVATTSVFFGVRGLTRAIFNLLGMPRPVYFVVSAILSSCLSEAAKALGRDSDNNIKRLRSEIEVDLDVPEVSGDIIKWLVYDGLFQYSHQSTSMLEQSLMSFSYGASAAILGLLTTYVLTNRQPNGGVKVTVSMIRENAEQFGKVALEGGIMFLTFQSILSLLAVAVPQQLNYKFAFNNFLEKVEGEAF